MSNQLSVIETDAVVASMCRARLALSEAKNIQQTKVVVDAAKAAEIYARRQKLGDEASDLAISIKVEALRKLGEMLAATPRNDGAKGIGKSAVTHGNRTPTLEDIGLSKRESAVAQKLASLPEEEFQQVRDGHLTINKALNAVTATRNNKPTIIKETASEFEGQDFGPSAEEIESAQRIEREQLENLVSIAESDEPLKDALATVKRLTAENRVLSDRNNGLINENAVLKGTVKSLQRKLKEAEAANA